MRLLSIPATLLCAATVLTPVNATRAQAPEARHVVALDFVKAKPGELPRLIRFFELNWAAARATLVAQGADIVGYRMLVSADTASAWDVVLETTYADSASYARREQIFQPVLAAKGKVLVDGKDRSGLGDIVGSRVLAVRAATAK